MWYTPLLEHQSPLLHDFEAFVEKLSGSFRDSDKELTSTSKLWLFYQKPCLVIVYAYEFKQLALDAHHTMPTNGACTER